MDEKFRKNKNKWCKIWGYCGVSIAPKQVIFRACCSTISPQFLMWYSVMQKYSIVALAWTPHPHHGHRLWWMTENNCQQPLISCRCKATKVSGIALKFSILGMTNVFYGTLIGTQTSRKMVGHDLSNPLPCVQIHDLQKPLPCVPSEWLQYFLSVKQLTHHSLNVRLLNNLTRPVSSKWNFLHSWNIRHQKVIQHFISIQLQSEFFYLKQ